MWSVLVMNVDYSFQPNRSWQIIGQQSVDRRRRAMMCNAAAGGIENRHHWQLNYIFASFLYKTCNFSVLDVWLKAEGLEGVLMKD